MFVEIVLNMQLTRGLRDAASCVSRQQQRVPSVVHFTGWSSRTSVEQTALLASCSNASTSSMKQYQRQLPRRAIVAAAEAGDAEAATDAEIGIHEVQELRGIRANLDSQDPVVEYRVHWKDGSPDTWCVHV